MSGYAAIVLAAGLGLRFKAGGGREATKLVAGVGGEPLVRRVVKAVVASQARPIVVVTGHARDAVEAALRDLPVTPAHNPAFLQGLSSSLRTGLAAVPADAAGAVVILADMPGVTAAILDSLIERARMSPLAHAVVPVHAGRRGNPSLLHRALFDRLAALSGDRGARGILDDPDLTIEHVEQPAAIFEDVDHPDDLAGPESADSA